ncbi:putative assembly protein [Rickettsiales bacterium Ac37b]|nr:putative assembly protein [Rickettsiales bacterium Ac37b]
MQLPRFIKYSVIFFACIIIILLIIPFFIPLDSYKQLAVNKVKEATGRELQINGPIALSLLPVPTIKIKDVSLASIAGAENDSLLKVSKISASVSILSLLKGNLDISSIIINDPILNLERTKNGASSWEFIKTEANANSNVPSTQSNEGSTSTNLSIGLIEIANGQLNYLDSTSANNAPITIYIDNLAIKNLHGPDNIRAELHSTGKNYSISGNIHEKEGIIAIKMNLEAFKEKATIIGDLKRDNMNFIGQFNLQGNAKNLEDILPNIKIIGARDYTITSNINASQKLLSLNEISLKSGNIVANGGGSFSTENGKINLQVELNPGNINLTLTSGTPTSNNVISEKLSVKANALKPLLDELAIDIKEVPASLLNKAFILITDLGYSEQNLSLNNISLNIDKANLKGDLGIKDWNKNMSANYNLQIDNPEIFANLFAVNLPINLGGVSIKGSSTKEQDFINTNTTLLLAGSSSNIQGNVGFKKSIIPNLTIESIGNSLGNLIAQLTKSSSNSDLGKYSLLAKIDGDVAHSIKIDINKFDVNLKNSPMNLKGIVNIDLANNKPKISSDIQIGSINLSNTSSSAPRSTYTQSAASSSSSSISPWSNEKIDLASLKKFDADINLNIKQIIKDNLIFDTIQTTLSLSNGNLGIKSLRGKLFGGSLEGNGQISADGPANLKVNLQQASLKNITGQKGTFKILNGIVNLTADLKTTGHTQRQYVNNLSGNVNLTANSGTISGFDLQKILNLIQSIKNPTEILQIFDKSFSGGDTQFNDLTISAEIKNGIAHISSSKLNAGRIEAATSGNVNLPSYTCDINSIINLDSKKSYPPFTVHFYGNLNNVQHKVMLKDLQQYLINNVLKGIIKGQNPLDIIKNLGKNQESEPEEGGNQSNPVDDLIGKGIKGLMKKIH